MDEDDQAANGGSSASAAMEETARGDASDVPGAMHHLRLKVHNKARVEGSIVEACTVQQITNCVSLYFSDHVQTTWNRKSRYNNGGKRVQNDGCSLDVFQYEGTLHGRGEPRDLTCEELNAAKLYILTNCSVVDRFREMTRHLTHRPISRPIRNGLSTGSVGNNGSSQPASQTRKARTPRSRTGSGDRLEEIDRPLIVPSGIRWEKHPFKSREPSTVQGALVCQYYPEAIGPDDNKKPVLTWEDYKWSSNPRVQTAASRIKEEFWWRFKCNPSDQRDADETLELNLAEKVRQMIHEEKKTAMKRLYKRGNVTEEKDGEGNIWSTVAELISTKRDDFGTDDGWRLLCEYWSTQESRNNSLRGKRNRLANGDTIYHCSGARSIVATRQYLKQKTGKDPGLAGAWQHTHRLKRGNERVEMCSQKASDRWETFDNGMKNVHGENWQEEHPEFDGSVIYETTGRMPHGRLKIADEAFTKIDKSIIKATKIRVSQQEQSAREQERLQRENQQLRQENKELRGVAQVVRALIYRGGLDYDALMEEGAQHESGTYDSEQEYYSDSDLYDELARRRDRVDQTGPEPGPGSNVVAGDNHMEGGNINDEREST